MIKTFDTVEEYWDRSDATVALEAALQSSTDPIKEFEDAFTSFVGGLDAAFLLSGRAAIHQALQLLNVKRNDEIILPAFLCSVVADSVLQTGATPVLVDVNLPSGELDLQLVRQALSAKTRAVIIPHLFGIPLDFREIIPELEKLDVAIIEDCAHCLGAQIGSQTAGSLGTFSIFSFNYDKPISLSNGGMLVCSDQKWLKPFRCWKSQTRQQFSRDPQEEFEGIESFLDWLAVRRSGIRQTRLPTRSNHLRRKVRQHPTLDWVLRHIRPVKPQENTFGPVGTLKAHLGLSLLQRYPYVLSKRNYNANYIRNQAVQKGWGQAYSPPAHIRPAHLRFNLYADQLSVQQVDYVAAKLCREGFRAGRYNWSRSLDQTPHLLRRCQSRSQLTNAHKMAGHCLNLPIHQNMNQDDLDRMLSLLWSVKV